MNLVAVIPRHADILKSSWFRRLVTSLRYLCFSMLGIGLSLAPASARLIHEWNFDERSGNALHDTVGMMDAKVVTLAGGGGHALTGNAVRLDGGDRATADFIRLPASVLDGLTDVTFEIWAAQHSIQNWARVIDIGPGDSVPNPASENFRLSFSVGTDGNQQWMGYRPIQPAASELPTDLDRIYHYAVTWSATGADDGGGRLEWYRDGVFVAGQNTGSASIASLAALEQAVIWLGRSAYTVDSTANASFHAMRIYDEALEPEVIALHTLHGPDGDGPLGVDGLIHRWSFSERTGTALADSVGAADGGIDVLGGGGGHQLGGGQLRLFGGAKETSDYVALPGGLLEGLSDVTIEAWATPHSAPAWARLFDFGSGADTDRTFFLSLARGTSLDLQRLEFDNEPAWQIDTELDTTAGEEHHYVVTWSATGGPGGGGRAEWYRDGVLAGSIDTGATTIADVDDTVLWLGRSHWPDPTADSSFNELRIYDRVLMPAEITFNHINGPASVTLSPTMTVDDAMTLNPGAMALIPVLDNDTGARPDPATVAIVDPPAFGTVAVQNGGKVLYTHDGGSSATDAFTYTVQNSTGATSEPATVHVTIDPSLRLPNTTIAVPNEPPSVTYRTVNAFPDLFFEDPVAIRTPQGVTNQIFIAERRGIISYIPDIHAETPARQVMVDIRGQVQFDDTPQGEMGLLGFDFHPGFLTNGYVFVFYVASGPRQNRLSRFTANPGTRTVNPNTEVILFSVEDQVFNHNGGDVHFGPNGYLYVSMGDEGDQYNARQNAQRIDRDLYSGILRIDVDKRPGNVEPNPHPAIPTDGQGAARYSIPIDNPFVHTSLGGEWDGTFHDEPVSDLSLVRAEFFAIGFRHVWRFSIDSVTGDIWAGDVGQDRYEEVNLVVKGGNYGWAYYEGTTLARSLYPNQPNLPTDPPPGLIPPIYEYIHAGLGGDPAFHGDSVTGGIVYRGDGIPELTGAYLFADFEFQNIWALRREDGQVTVERIGADLGIAAFGVDPSNDGVLFANYFQNSIKRLVRTEVLPSTFPEKLSDTGVFADLDTLTPNPGIVSYEPKIAFWSDHAEKRRWFTIPNLNDTVGFDQDGNWPLPAGMKWIKHFDLALDRGNPSSTKRRLETRILVKTDDGNYGVSYRWNDSQDDAVLVDEGGDTFFVTVTNQGIPMQQLWEIPSRADCLACHTTAGGHALTFNTRQMNHVADLNAVHGNQIDVLQSAGYFSDPVPSSHTLPVHAQVGDAEASLGFRARSYLAVNCAQCHQAGGTGGGVFDVRPHLTLAQTKLINGALDNNGGDPSNRVVVAGDLDHSVLWRRLQAGDGFSRMPPLATHQLDQSAIELLGAWIAEELPSQSSYEDWIAQYPTLTGPAAVPAADPDADGADNQTEFLTLTHPDDTIDVWKLAIGATSDSVAIEYQRPPHLGVIIETSANLDQWAPWETPRNHVFFGISSSPVLLEAPLSQEAPFQFFRARFVQP